MYVRVLLTNTNDNLAYRLTMERCTLHMKCLVLELWLRVMYWNVTFRGSSNLNVRHSPNSPTLVHPQTLGIVLVECRILVLFGAWCIEGVARPEQAVRRVLTVVMN